MSLNFSNIKIPIIYSGNVEIDKAYLGSSLVYQRIRDIVAVYESGGPGQIVLATKEEYNNAGGTLEKTIPGILVKKGTSYSVSFETIDRQWEIMDRGDYFEYYDYNWFYTDMITLTPNYETNTTAVVISIGSYDPLEADVILYDYSQTTPDYSLIPSIDDGNYTNYTIEYDGSTIYLYKNNNKDNPTKISFGGSELLRSIKGISNSITDLSSSFSNCVKLMGAPVSGPNVINMVNAYYGCESLVGPPVSGPNVTNMVNTYYNCYNMKGNPACGDNVTNMCSTYSRCYNITGNAACGPKVTDMSNTYYYCFNLSSPVCGNNVTNMVNTYSECRNLKGNPVCGPKVTDMSNAYYYCTNLTGSPACGSNVTDMSWTYMYCRNLTGAPVCGSSVTNMNATYSYCYNMKGNPVCGANVIQMTYTYRECENLTGSPVCGNKVTNMSYAYADCYNIKGNAVCGPNVTNMTRAYSNCWNITGSPVHGDKVTSMSYAYYNCIGLTGQPVCKNSITDMSGAYCRCNNLTGYMIIGNSVTNASYAYAYANNFIRDGHLYVYGKNITDASGCVRGKGTAEDSTRLDIYLVNQSNTSTSCKTFISNSPECIFGSTTNWTLRTNESITDPQYKTTYTKCYINTMHKTRIWFK